MALESPRTATSPRACSPDPRSAFRRLHAAYYLLGEHRVPNGDSPENPEESWSADEERNATSPSSGWNQERAKFAEADNNNKRESGPRQVRPYMLPFPCALNYKTLPFPPEVYLSQIRNLQSLHLNPFWYGVVAANNILPNNDDRENRLIFPSVGQTDYGFCQTEAISSAKQSNNPAKRSGAPFAAACTENSPPPPKIFSPNIRASPKPRCATSRTFLPFSVDNILKPDFGKTTLNNARKNKLIELKCGVERQRKKDACVRDATAAVYKASETAESSGKWNCSSGSQVSACASQPAVSPTLSRFSDTSDCSSIEKDANGKPWPAWVYCTRYSDRPSSGPRSRRQKRRDRKAEEKRPRTAFTGEQLNRLKREFEANNYLNEKRRQDLAKDMGLQEAQIKIWFQNKRAKMKKSRGVKNPLALELEAQGLYNHSTMPISDDEDVDSNHTTV